MAARFGPDFTTRHDQEQANAPVQPVLEYAGVLGGLMTVVAPPLPQGELITWQRSTDEEDKQRGDRAVLLTAVPVKEPEK